MVHQRTCHVALSPLRAFMVLAAMCTLAASAIPLPEHPRPDWERPQWVNLNGQWDFGFEKGAYDRKITVPFGWGCEFSGVKNEKGKNTGYYRRMVKVPPEWKGKRVFLVVGASDYKTEFSFDGKNLGKHVGGYMPFEFELTDLVKWGEEQTAEFMKNGILLSKRLALTGNRVHVKAEVPRGLKLNGFGKGWFEYEVAVPPQGGTFRAELSAKRRNWKDRKERGRQIDYVVGKRSAEHTKNPSAYPQTSDEKFPANLAVRVGIRRRFRRLWPALRSLSPWARRIAVDRLLPCPFRRMAVKIFGRVYCVAFH